MASKNKKKKKKTKAQLTQSSTATAAEPQSGEGNKKKKGKNKKKKASKSKTSKNPKILPNKTKKKKKNTNKGKTQTNIKLNDKPKKKKKQQKGKKSNAARDRSKTSNTKPSNKKPTKSIKDDTTIQLNTISHSPPPKPQKAASTKKSKKFPWANWIIDRGDVTDTDDEKDDDPHSSQHRQRRSSLGSIRELHIARAKKAKSGKKGGGGGGHRNHRHRHKKDKKVSNRHDVDGVDIYNPNAMKQKRRKDKEKHKFKVVPKHHVKRSSLPTYNSIRKNNPQLKFYVKKETQRNLATLLDQPEKRTKSKKLKNLSRAGFDLHVNKRYRLEDGRIGVCKFKGRTEFGKSSEDWIGLVIEIGEGEHDGSVQGKTYFRCRDGKGLFVRPYDIVECLGSHTKTMSKQDIKLAKQRIKRYKKEKGNGDRGEMTTSTTVVESDQDGKMINPDHGYNMMNEKFYNPKTLLDKNKGKKAKKKKHHTQV